MTAALSLSAASRALQEEQPLSVLRWATANVGRVAFATGFGAEGCVVILTRASGPAVSATAWASTGVSDPDAKCSV